MSHLQIRPIADPRTLDAAGLWRRALVIGTPATIAAVASQLECLESAPIPVGCLIAGAARQLPASSRGQVRGLPILGDIDDFTLLHATNPFSGAIVSLPSSMGPSILRVRALLRAAGVVERFIPAIDDLLAAPPASRAAGATLDLVELIGRTPYGIDRRAVARVIEGKTVLVTGAGGSIGSEICRIVATFRPEQLVLMERSENALFEIDRQIARRFPEIKRRAVLHDVVDAEQTLRHLVALKPHTIFHSAAHKHVPLMEDHPAHAVTNNLFGTKSIADAAAAVGAERFVMISSDKAVNPTSVMGATKRLAEMYVQAMAAAGSGRARRTSFSMVRFGNVLGSACSVLPIWTAQLAEGGPITVTDPRMTRYFMTINEAATLVIQAATIDAKDGESPTIFVLDMGEPLRISDLAHRFVRLNGFEPLCDAGFQPASSSSPDASIDIIFTGARPGEKLHEELAYAAESLLQTPYPGIMALASSTHADFDVASMVADFSALRTSSDRDAIVAAIRRHVPEMVGARTVQTSNNPAPAQTAAA